MRPWAPIRSAGASRFFVRLVREERTCPPLIFGSGHTRSHEQNVAAVGKREKSGPIFGRDHLGRKRVDTRNLRRHKTIKHRDGMYFEGDITTNGIESAFSLLKRGIIGSWHKFSAKHLPA
jgi:hypothetical protein